MITKALRYSGQQRRVLRDMYREDAAIILSRWPSGPCFLRNLHRPISSRSVHLGTVKALFKDGCIAEMGPQFSDGGTPWITLWLTQKGIDVAKEC